MFTSLRHEHKGPAVWKHDRVLGFALIASLLLLVLLSGVAIGLMMMVNTEGRVGSHDVQNSLAYRSAEGAIEKMTADLANKFQSVQSPQVSDITGLSSLVPTNDSAVTYPVYSLVPATNPNGVNGCTNSAGCPLAPIGAIR